MELRHVRYFVAVAEAAHFTRAAEELRISQPALSQQVRQLEEEIGARLFDRRGRRVRLTPAGEIFQASARRILREVEDTHAAIADLAALERGRVSLGAVQTVNSYLVPEIVSVFNAAHPRVMVKVDELSADDVEAGVIDGSLDLGVAFVPARQGAIRGEELFAEQLVLVTAQKHRLSGRRRVALRELDGEPLILLPTTFCTRRLIEHAFESAGVQPRVAVEMSSIEGILRTVRSTGGATIVPALAATMWRELALRAALLTEPSPRRVVGLLWAGVHRSAAAARFAQCAASVVRRKIESGELRRLPPSS